MPERVFCWFGIILRGKGLLYIFYIVDGHQTLMVHRQNWTRAEQKKQASKTIQQNPKK